MVKASKRSRRGKRDPSQAVKDRMRDGAILAALTGSLGQAAALLGLRKPTLYANVERHPEVFQQFKTWAEGLVAKAGRMPDKGKRMRPGTEKRIAVGAVLCAYGLSRAKAASVIGTHPKALNHDSIRHREVWNRHYSRAKALIRRPVRKDGTDGDLPEEKASRLIQAAMIEGAGRSRRQAAIFLGLSRSALDDSISRNRPFFETQKQLAEPIMRYLGIYEDAAKRQSGIRASTREKMIQCAVLIGEGKDMTAASETVFRNRRALHQQIRRHPQVWLEIVKKIGAPAGRGGSNRNPTPKVRMRIEKLGLIVASGLSMAEASRRLGLPSIAGSHYKSKYPDLWKEAVRRGRKALRIPKGVVQRVTLWSEKDGKRVCRVRLHGSYYRRGFKRGTPQPENGEEIKRRKRGGRNRSPAAAIVLQELGRDPKMTRQHLASIINRKCGRLIADGTMKKATAESVRALIRRMRKCGEFPPASHSRVTKP